MRTTRVTTPDRLWHGADTVMRERYCKALATAGGAMTRPKPESRSIPIARMSSAVEVMASLICAGVRDGFADLIRAAIPAAWGAAAEVPKNGLKPDVRVVTPSAA